MPETSCKDPPFIVTFVVCIGCACIRTEDWEGARNAFSRCVAIDEDDGESWSNLASVYLRLGTNRNAVEVRIFLDFYTQVMNSLNFILRCWTTTP